MVNKKNFCKIKEKALWWHALGALKKDTKLCNGVIILKAAYFEKSIGCMILKTCNTGGSCNNELHDLNNTRIKLCVLRIVPQYWFKIIPFVQKSTMFFRDTCYLCLHVKKRFPKRKIKAWIVQTLLACSKLPTIHRINFSINPWFI